MIYIVSGYMRSGTSMMMKALEAGGLEACYSIDRDKSMNDKWGDADYKPNDSYMELDFQDYRDPSFPEAYEGKLIKCLYGGLLHIKPGEYRVVMMRRPQKAIQTSLTAFFGRSTPLSQNTQFQDMLDNVVSILKDRQSFLSVDELWYDDVLDNPHVMFQHLYEKGWPIDVDKAASIPTPKKKRYDA